jgi:hypothetical protein
LKKVNHALVFLILFACAEDRTDADGDEGIPDQDVESQDEGDQGYGARPGGGFTSVVSILRVQLRFKLKQYRLPQRVPYRMGGR